MVTDSRKLSGFCLLTSVILLGACTTSKKDMGVNYFTWKTGLVAPADYPVPERFNGYLEEVHRLVHESMSKRMRTTPTRDLGKRLVIGFMSQPDGSRSGINVISNDGGYFVENLCMDAVRLAKDAPPMPPELQQELADGVLPVFVQFEFNQKFDDID